MSDWKQKANESEKIWAWLDMLKSSYTDIPKEITPAEFIEMEMRFYEQSGREKGPGYDYIRAIEAGIEPGFDPETRELHWPSFDPKGQHLKGAKHPTRHKAVK